MYNLRAKQIGFVSTDGSEFITNDMDKGKARNCELGEGERVTSVVVTWQTELRTMVFKTSAGSKCSFGTYKGENSQEIATPEGKELIGMKGTFQGNYISSMALIYKSSTAPIYK